MPYTITLPSDIAWLSDPANPDNIVVCGTRDTAGVADTLDGDIRVYAGGVVEGVVREQDIQTRDITLCHLTAADLAQVRAWRGTPLLLRTSDGYHAFVFYLATDHHRVMRTTPSDGIGSTTYDVDVTFTQISFDETLL